MFQPAVIIAHDDATLVQDLAVRCKHMALDVYCSSSAMHALLDAHRLQPKVLILNIDLPGARGACELLANDKSFEMMSIIILSEQKDDTSAELCSSRKIHFIQKNSQLLNELHELIRRIEGGISEAIATEFEPGSAHTENPTVVCIDDDPDITRAIKIRLKRFGVNVVSAYSGMEGFWTALKCQPSAIICDMNMPDGEGNYINGRLKSHPLTKDIPVIILTGQANTAVKRQMYGLGVAAYLQKPLDFNELLETLRIYMPLAEPTAPVDRVLVPHAPA